MEANLQAMRQMQGFADSGVMGSRNSAHAAVKRRLKAKIAELAASPPLLANDTKSFELRVELIGLFGDHPDELGSQPGLQTGECAGGVEGSRVFATLRVSASLTLQDLHSHAVAPALGYRRRYHAYIFTDPKDGAQFGIEGQGHPMLDAGFLRGPVDLMHMPHYGYEVIDDRTVMLSQLLSEPGDQLLYLSDLGDIYNHSITVVGRSLDASPSVRVIDASCPKVQEEPGTRFSSLLTCPHEDGDGSRGWCERHEKPIKHRGIPRHRVYKDRTALMRELQEKVDDASERHVSVDDDGHGRMSGYDERTGRYFNMMRDGWEPWEKIAHLGNQAPMIFVEACEQGNAVHVQAALAARPRLSNSREPGSFSALHMAAWDGHASIVEMLLNAGALVDVLTQDGISPLALAAHAGHADVVGLLLSANASVNIAAIGGEKATAGQTALHSAAQENYPNIVRLLLAAGADTTLVNEPDFDPLSLAVRKGHAQVVSEILAARRTYRDVNIRSEEGVTPLMMACFYGFPTIVRLLIEAHADVDTHDLSGQTAFTFAYRRDMQAPKHRRKILNMLYKAQNLNGEHDEI
jgi:ankyrin repeat protein